MRYAFGIDAPSILEGRKAAILGGGGIAMVPASTLPGDIIYTTMLKTELVAVVVRTPLWESQLPTYKHLSFLLINANEERSIRRGYKPEWVVLN
jgi:hypothetical protein